MLPVLYYAAIHVVAYVAHITFGWERLQPVLEFLLFLPIGWTEMIYNMLFTREMFDSYSLTFMSLFIFGNFTLYAVLTYAFLGRFAATSAPEV
ncbi:MAG TPA: hypothetical protein VGB61_05440 [Pyrinomonadaceae bacterium]